MVDDQWHGLTIIASKYDVDTTNPLTKEEMKIIFE